MNTRIAAAVAALVIGAAAPASSAMAFPFERDNGPLTTGSIGVHDLPFYESHPGYCAPSSAAEGNANQQTRPVKQYGQTTGGNRC
ncbi:hypothetical protein [Methylobacterium aerolatum]|uniref:Uncharacterized protein n=1 Tax=Methylobacterium aerolatum TaxID=418708 RepID=A0ABU0HY77_9HYPH|nr:hypothetical protein [Methylobacterium aerolatum]MDQ0446441.1 hypothetical protein [Methylobacterium aerolatum]GJD33396.1 hypothetical protein FMGBMHLM_0283 [Methylobacterium aerolatum]